MRSTTIATFAGMAALLCAPGIPAQTGIGQGVQCGTNEVAVPSFGLSGLECRNCTLYDSEDPGGRRWEFRSEPTILGVRRDGPADGRLREGDIVVAVDGFLVTTREGGRRIAQPAAGRAAEFRIRREGREMDVSVTPSIECRPAPDRPRAVAGVVSAGRVGVAPVPARVADSVRVTRGVVTVFPTQGRSVSLGQLMPRGKLGVSLSCEGCSVQLVDDSARIWSFSNPPTVVSVEAGSPAAVTGLKSGDRIVTIDGVAITTEVGGRRFGEVAPGERVQLGVVRGGNNRVFTIRAGEPVKVSAGVNVGVALPSPTQPETVRYTGRLGDTMIDVTGEPVVVTQTETEIIIKSGDITVRLRRDTGRDR
jgi:S1-C subfamily serine protease